MTATWHTGDSLTVLRTLPDNSVDLVLTSPPFLALRSYLPDDDPAKALELGSEPTPGEFIDALLDVTEELRRVLAPHGSICVELGDTYAGSGGAGGDYNADGLREGQQAFSGSARKARKSDPKAPRGEAHDVFRREHACGKRNNDFHAGWPNDKSLTLIPELYRMALAYGINPLTGRTTPRWRIRNVIRWVRPNPPVGALGDKFRPGTSEMVVATGIDEAGRTRYFDLDAVRTGFKHPDLNAQRRSGAGPTFGQKGPNLDRGDLGAGNFGSGTAGAPPLDWWEIPTKGYAGSHYATFPPALCERPIKAMCPVKVCTVCGEPSRRITSDPTYERTDSDRVPARLTMNDGERPAEGVNQFTRPDGANTSVTRVTETIGWSCCGHGEACTPTTWATRMTEVEQGKATDGKWYDLDELDGEPTAIRTKRKRKRVLDHAGDCDRTHWRTGVVLDPFGGSGTTAMVATGHGRDAISIDLDIRNVDLARERIGPMFFQHVNPEAAASA